MKLHCFRLLIETWNLSTNEMISHLMAKQLMRDGNDVYCDEHLEPDFGDTNDADDLGERNDMDTDHFVNDDGIENGRMRMSGGLSHRDVFDKCLGKAEMKTDETHVE